jgi:tRNA-2-methylthio-N6-dimethylallyladenosine synthase
VPEAEKDTRLAALQALLRDQQAAFNASRAGMTIPVLITGPGRHPGQVAGRSPWLQPVHAEGPAGLAGQVVPVEILAGHPNSLAGKLVPDGRAARTHQPEEEPAPA